MSLPSSEGSEPTCDLLENQNKVAEERVDAPIHNGELYRPVSSTQMEELIEEIKGLREDQRKSGKWNGLVSYTMLLVAFAALITSLANLNIETATPTEASLFRAIVYIFTIVMVLLIVCIIFSEFSEKIRENSAKNKIIWIIFSGGLSLGLTLLLSLIVTPLLILFKIESLLLYSMIAILLVIFIGMQYWLKSNQKDNKIETDSNTP